MKAREGMHISCLCSALPFAMLGVASVRRRGPKVFVNAVKGGKGGNHFKKGRGADPAPTKVSKVTEGAAYAQETRKMILELDNVDKTAVDGKIILKDVCLGMYMGAKIGILGTNGAGKSTVMRILAGKDTDFDGELKLDPSIRIGYLEQEPVLEAETVIENLEPALAHTKAMLTEFEEVSAKMADPDEDMDALLARMDTLQCRIDACNGWELDSTVNQAMEALRCPPRDAKVATLSGGEQRRVAICRLLLSNPDILLLDEPTNHLDAQSVAWLERFLADFKGTVVAITHDRYFLDNVAGWILELDEGKGIPFEGNYSSWLESKAYRLANAAKKKVGLEAQIKKELEYVKMQRSGQQKKGKARLRKYESLVAEAASFNRNAGIDSIVITPGPQLRGVVVKAKGLCKGFGERMLISDANFDFPPGAVVGIVGPNGAGKSTLFKMIMGTDLPDAGEIIVGDSVAPMYVDQTREGLAGDNSVYEELTGELDTIDVGGRMINSRQYASWFNFRGNIMDREVSSLSGGERNRLQLAKTLRLGGNLLMLDEPTNDLDIDTLRALETAIENFAGTVVCVSHDRWFLDRIATHILAYEGDSQLVFFPGSYSEYEEDRVARTGFADPTQVKYRPMPKTLA